MGSLSQFEEYADPLLRAHLTAGNGVGGIGFLEAVENADYLLHAFILLWLKRRGLSSRTGESTPTEFSIDPLEVIEKFGGDDGARTRDLRRDRKRAQTRVSGISLHLQFVP